MSIPYSSAYGGDPSLARWGLDAEVHGEGQATLYHVRVTPNHHALAERFGLSDNFYVDSDVSFDGHHWLVDSYPNEWVETMWPPSHEKHSHLFYDDDAPGRLSLETHPESPPSNCALQFRRAERQN